MIKILFFICALIMEGFAQSVSLNPWENWGQSRIVGGKPIDIKDAPYQVALRTFGFLFCGGTIIDAEWVLTAAHCTHFQRAEQLTIRVGSTSSIEGGLVIPVDKIIQHDLYNYDSGDYDFSLLKLKSPITFDQTKMKMHLPEQDEPLPDGTLCTVSGWGSIQSGESLEADLRSAEVPILSHSYCHLVYTHTRKVTDRMICAGYKAGGIDACQGDSGGPLVADYKLVGVVSWGKGCATNPGVYARVSYVRNWIRNVTGI